MGLTVSMRALEEIVATHRGLRRFLALVEGAGEALVSQLDWLRSTLPRHFATEEQPGGFFDAVARRPGGDSVVRSLREEHRALERELAAIVAAHGRGEPVEERLRTFGQHLAAHERREAELGLDLDDLALPPR